MTNRIISYILIATIVIFSFFGYALKIPESMQGVIAMILAILCLVVYRIQTIKLGADSKMWLIYIVLMVLSLMFSVNIINSVKYIIMLGGLLFSKIIIDNINISAKKVEKIVICIGILHVLATLIYLLMPNLIQMFASKILSTSSYIYNINLFKHGMIAGIASEHGANAIFITIVLAFLMPKAMTKPSGLNIILTIMCIIALLLTGKRGPLIANIVAFLIVFIKYNLKNKKELKSIAVFCIFATVIIGILNYIPATQIVFERYTESMENNELLTGRESFYSAQIEAIKNHVITGIGIRGVHELIGNNDGHNIYLQVFAELGVFGIILLLLILFANLIRTLKGKNNSVTLISLYFQIFFIIYGFSGNPMYLFTTLSIYFLVTSQIFLKGGIKNEENRNINVS